MTAVQLDENIHLRITKKRAELMEKYGKRIDMKDIAGAAIEAGFDRIEEKLGLVR